MTDTYVLVLNAGSSSLKFSVFQRERDDWEAGARGQVEGLGTSPRLSAKDARGGKLADEALDPSVRDGRAAIEFLAVWLRARFQGGRIVGVGHRVVHGGPRFGGPAVVTRAILAEPKALTPLAPLHQPHNLAPIETIRSVDSCNFSHASRRRIASAGIAIPSRSVRTSRCCG